MSVLLHGWSLILYHGEPVLLWFLNSIADTLAGFGL